MKTTYHRDGTVTVWDTTTQGWVRASRVPDHVLASLSDDERTAILRHVGGDYGTVYPSAAEALAAAIGHDVATVLGETRQAWGRYLRGEASPSADRVLAWTARSGVDLLCDGKGWRSVAP